MTVLYLINRKTKSVVLVDKDDYERSDANGSGHSKDHYDDAGFELAKPAEVAAEQAAAARRAEKSEPPAAAAGKE